MSFAGWWLPSETFCLLCCADWQEKGAVLLGVLQDWIDYGQMPPQTISLKYFLLLLSLVSWCSSEGTEYKHCMKNDGQEYLIWKLTLVLEANPVWCSVCSSPHQLHQSMSRLCTSKDQPPLICILAFGNALIKWRLCLLSPWGYCRTWCREIFWALLMKDTVQSKCQVLCTSWESKGHPLKTRLNFHWFLWEFWVEPRKTIPRAWTDPSGLLSAGIL